MILIIVMIFCTLMAQYRCSDTTDKENHDLLNEIIQLPKGELFKYSYTKLFKNKEYSELSKVFSNDAVLERIKTVKGLDKLAFIGLLVTDGEYFRKYFKFIQSCDKFRRFLSDQVYELLIKEIFDGEIYLKIKEESANTKFHCKRALDLFRIVIKLIDEDFKCNVDEKFLNRACESRNLRLVIFELLAKRHGGVSDYFKSKNANLQLFKGYFTEGYFAFLDSYHIQKAIITNEIILKITDGKYDFDSIKDYKTMYDVSEKLFGKLETIEYLKKAIDTVLAYGDALNLKSLWTCLDRKNIGSSFVIYFTNELNRAKFFTFIENRVLISNYDDFESSKDVLMSVLINSKALFKNMELSKEKGLETMIMKFKKEKYYDKLDRALDLCFGISQSAFSCIIEKFSNDEIIEFINYQVKNKNLKEDLSYMLIPYSKAEKAGWFNKARDTPELLNLLNSFFSIKKIDTLKSWFLKINQMKAIFEEKIQTEPLRGYLFDFLDILIYFFHVEKLRTIRQLVPNFDTLVLTDRKCIHSICKRITRSGKTSIEVIQYIYTLNAIVRTKVEEKLNSTP